MFHGLLIPSIPYKYMVLVGVGPQPGEFLRRFTAVSNKVPRALVG